LPFISIIDYLFYAVPGVLVQTIPMGAFLGVMLVYGGLSETNEIVAMEGSGIGLFRIIRPAFIFGVILTLIGLGLELYVNPRALKNINAQTKQVLASKPSSLSEEKVFLTNEEKGFGFYIDEVNNEKATAKNFLIINKRGDNPYPIVFLAENAKFDPGIIRLQKVKGYAFEKNGNSRVSAEYQEQEIPITIFFREDTKEKKKSRNEMNIKDQSVIFKCVENNIECIDTDSDSIVIEFISPTKEILRKFMKNWKSEKKDAEITNKSSIVFLLSYQNKNILMTGDSYTSVFQKRLFGLRKIDAVKLPHHGSKNGNNAEILQLIDRYKCRKVIVSTNEGDKELDKKLMADIEERIGKDNVVYSYNTDRVDKNNPGITL